jgi:ABC-type multidrug transport system ATPase subunit
VDATRILDILAGRTTRGKIYGEVCLNGNPISVDRLGSRVAYVRKDYRLHGWISVEHTLAFHARLRSRDLGANYLDTKVLITKSFLMKKLEFQGNAISF